MMDGAKGERAGDGVCARALAGGARAGSLRHGLLALLALLSTAGCATMPLFGLKAAKFDQADPKNPAIEVLAFWQPSDGPGPAGVPVRGFGGQVYFFTKQNESPVLVDGTVRIYVFDDQGSVKQQSKPIGEFDFDSRHWNALAHGSALGPGYGIFIPYPKNDFHQANCSMRIRFTPASGPTIYSAPATVVLSGPQVKSERPDEPNIQPPQQRVTQERVQYQQFQLPPRTGAVSGPQARLPYSQNVTAVNGTDADTRMSLADEIAAPNDNRVQTADYSDDGPPARASRFRLQSAQSASTDRDDD
jgi:hypothetical protein